MPSVSDHQLVLEGIARQLRPNGWAIFTYDPVRRDQPVQCKEQEVVDNNGMPFLLHRHFPTEMAAAISQAGLLVITDTESQSQPLGDTSIRTQLVVAQQPGFL